MKILTAAQMRDVDRWTTERYQLPSLLLMENAAARTVEATERRFGSVHGKSALVCCGKGNNGGDGATIARQLYTRGCTVTVLLLGQVDATKGDARTNFEAALALAKDKAGLRFLEVDNSELLNVEFARQPYDLYFDALFGTGLTRPAAGLFEQAIDLLNQHTPVIAVDLPSGLNSDVAELIGKTVKADLTVTFTAPKIASALPPACEWNGELVVAGIGSPDTLIRDAHSQLNLIEESMIVDWLISSRRTAHAHKGDAGKVLIIAGSRGKTGAAALAGESALRSGTGLVTVATAESAQAAVASRLIAECMSEGLAETASGSISDVALDEALRLAAERDVIALGPGLGSAEEATRHFVRELVTKRNRPMVIDADGLNALDGWTEHLQGTAELPIILTPHAGEMARLVGKTTKEVAENRLQTAQDFAREHQVIVLLKGSRTIVAAPDGEAYINPTGNAGMATGGSGDVLTGILAGLLAQKRDDALGATLAGVYLHGLAGDLAAQEIGMRALVASDISHHLGAAFLAIGGDKEKP